MMRVGCVGHTESLRDGQNRIDRLQAVIHFMLRNLFDAKRLLAGAYVTFLMI